MLGACRYKWSRRQCNTVSWRVVSFCYIRVYTRYLLFSASSCCSKAWDPAGTMVIGTNRLQMYIPGTWYRYSGVCRTYGVRSKSIFSVPGTRYVFCSAARVSSNSFHCKSPPTYYIQLLYSIVLLCNTGVQAEADALTASHCFRCVFPR